MIQQTISEKKQRIRQAVRRNTFKKISLWLLAFLLVGGVVLGAIKFGSSPSAEQTASLFYPLNNADWSKGNPGARVVLIEYSDFQCSACGVYFPLLKQLSEEFAGEVKFVYRHFPLRQIHPNAHLAARVSEAAGRQNKFWEMHDMLFEKQSEWSAEFDAKELFSGYAQALNLDLEKFQAELDSEKIGAEVDQDYEGGLKSEVNATPTFFLNGEKIPNPRNYDEFRDLLEKAVLENQ